MNIQRFFAPTSQEALAKARAAFGEGTLILSNRAIAGGVEVMATAEGSLGHLDGGAKTSANLKAAIQAREAEETRAPKNPKPPVMMKARAAQSVAEDTEQLAMSTLSFQDYVRERMLRRRSEEMAQGKSAPINPALSQAAGLKAAAPKAAAQSAHTPDRSMGRFGAGLAADNIPEEQLPTFARQRRAEAAQAAKTGRPISRHNPLRGLAAANMAAAGMDTSAVADALPAAGAAGMMGELQSVKNLIEERFNTLAWLGNTRQNPLHSSLILKMLRAGYSPQLARALLERLPASTTGAAESVQWLAQVLERNLRTDAAEPAIYEKGGIFALVGATGVGKTTTAAKLAALCARKYGADSVGLITLDTYRIGGHEQLRTYGRMLGVVAHLAHDRAALQDMLGLLAGKKMVLIDTSGVAPRDQRRDEILDVLNLGGVQRLLVANAGAHGDTLDEAMSVFKHKGCEQAILSKVDEAVKLGPALDATVRHKMTLRGITNGQRVPEDFERANARELIAASMRAHSKSAFDPSSLDLDFFYADSGLNFGPQGAAHV